MRTSILIADDEKNSREGLRKALEGESRKVTLAADGQEAFNILNSGDYDILITDIRMPNMDGMELLQKAKELYPALHVVMLTAYGTIEMAVEAMRLGAYSYLTKPINLDELDLLLERINQKRRLELEMEYYREQSGTHSGEAAGIIGESQVIRNLMEQIHQIAPSKATVLISGETGTGKELVARAIHQFSPRKDRVFVPVHCAALSENLLESELFGHERGAFTGAVKQRKGRFELADQGTLFLDEISEVSQSIQVKLLRILQEKEFERVGSTDTIKADIRFIAATNVNLQQQIKEDKFREDLYYRLKVVTITVPPLRDRKDDIPLLVRAFAKRFAKENGKSKIIVNDEVISILQQYDWPGNIRELQGVMESMVILSRSEVLSKENIPNELHHNVGSETSIQDQPLTVGNTTLSEIEKKVIFETLERCDGNRTKTAEVLGIGRRTLIRKLHDYGESKDEVE